MKEYKVLNHGIVKLIDHMGSDADIADAARVSYGGGTTKKNNNEGLIRYLMRHRHTSPFEMAELKFYLKMPIFIARQHFRHRTASVNEVSGRYSVLPTEVYEPALETISGPDDDNRQGRSQELTDEAKRDYIGVTRAAHLHASHAYAKALDLGVARELARIDLPLKQYTELVWKIDLHNLLHYIKLRMDEHAQYEIRVYANAMCEIVKELFPITYKAFEDYVINAVTFTSAEMALLKAILEVYSEDAGTSLETWAERLNEWNNALSPDTVLSKSELSEFKEKLT